MRALRDQLKYDALYPDPSRITTLANNHDTVRFMLLDGATLEGAMMRKFIRQKLHYIHMNPVRAGLCDHPAKWRWSSYHAYLPHEAGTVPIEVDQRWLWSEEELSSAHGERTSPLSKRKP